MEQDKDKIAFLKAFVKVQREIEPAKKDTLNPHFGKKYADLASCYEACREVLSNHGFVISQIPLIEGDYCVLKTTLSHCETGYEINGYMPICLKDLPPQQKGSALTYTRRQLLCSMVGIAPDDDDGNTANKQKEGAISGPFKKEALEDNASPGDYIIPFGKPKGQAIKTQSVESLKNTLAWCKTKNKAPEFQQAILAHLEDLAHEAFSSASGDEVLPFEEFDK